MGLLKTNPVLDFDKIVEIKDEIKRSGISQFIEIYNRKKENQTTFSVGDEIELMLTADQNGRKVLTLVGEEMIECFNLFHGNIVKMLESKEEIESTELECPSEGNSQKILDKYQNIIDTMKLPSHSKQELLYLLHYNLERTCSSLENRSPETEKTCQKIILVPEFASFMVETIPLTVQSTDFKKFFSDMHRRIDLVASLHKSFIPCSKVMLLTCFPMMYLDLTDLEQSNPENVSTQNSVFFDKKIKTYDFSKRAQNLTYEKTESFYFPDNAINSHPRFLSFLKNISTRRGRPIEGYIATMRDTCNKSNKISILGRKSQSGESANEENFSDFVPTILIDSMGQGMGCTCIQFTYQLENIEMAKFIFDQLTIFAPLLMRLTRSTPYNTNHLLNTDTRWNLISMSVDDRTREESGFDVEVKGLCKCGNCAQFLSSGFDVETSAKTSEEDENMPQWSKIRRKLVLKNLIKSDRPTNVKKSRYSASDFFLHQNGTPYNDTIHNINEFHRKMLLDGGVDENIANHVALLFERDPLIYYESNEEVQDEVKYDDFENIQSSNWRSTRFKIPIDDGWRVELRSLEIQPTIYENSNLAVFVSSLVTWLIDEYKQSKTNNQYFYIPMSKVEENMARASIFSHKESDYYDQNFGKNEEILDDFYEKCTLSNTGDSSLKVSDILGAAKNYEIKTPEDSVLFYHRDIKTGQIKESTLEHIFNPICEKLNEKFPQYQNEIEYIKALAQNKFASTSDFLRYSLINDPEYIKGSSHINRNMSDRLIIKMDKIRKMDHWLYKQRCRD